MREFKKAFTLAEVLITLLIIGVISSIVIPSLVLDFQKKIYVSQLKKAYTSLSQSVMLLQLDYDCINDLACTGIFNSSDPAVAPNAIVSHLNVIKRYDSTQTADIFANEYKSLHGNNLDDSDQSPPFCAANQAKTWGYKYLLSDGVALNIFYTVPCTKSSTSYCASVQVDINGPKPPNKTGRDFFNFAIMGDGTIYPAGGHRFGAIQGWEGTTVFNCTIPPLGDGETGAYGCAGRIMEEGWEMNY